MLRLNSRANPTALVLSASAGSASRAAALTACAIVSLGDQHMPLQRVELSLISPVALYEGVASERLSAASDAVRRADVVVAVAPLPGAACGGLLPAFLDALPVNALKGKVVVPLLFGGDAEALARFETALRRRLEGAGATVALGELFDARGDFAGDAAETGGPEVAARVSIAVREAALVLRRPVIQPDTTTARRPALLAG